MLYPLDRRYGSSGVPACHHSDEQCVRFKYEPDEGGEPGAIRWKACSKTQAHCQDIVCYLLRNDGSGGHFPYVWTYVIVRCSVYGIWNSRNRRFWNKERQLWKLLTIYTVGCNSVHDIVWCEFQLLLFCAVQEHPKGTFHGGGQDIFPHHPDIGGDTVCKSDEHHVKYVGCPATCGLPGGIDHHHDGLRIGGF